MCRRAPQQRGAYACLPCVTGRYQNKQGQTTCIFCSPGRSAANRIAKCQHCPAGRYTVTTASRNCHACPAGHFGTPGAAHAECAGRCGPGKFSAKGAAKCSKCSPGTFTVTHGVGNCTACPVGKHGLADGEHCKSCEPGRYAAVTGLTRCVPCPAGTYGLGGDKTARCHSRCRAGSFSKVGAYRCEYCAKGQYQTAAGKSASCVRPVNIRPLRRTYQQQSALRVPPVVFGPVKGASAVSCATLATSAKWGKKCVIRSPLLAIQNRRGAPACRPCVVGVSARYG